MPHGINRVAMPRKVRDLIADLVAAGFVDRGGKGSHRNFLHPQVPRPVTISGNPGDELETLPGKGGPSGDRGGKKMKESARYVKIVEWSNEDQCFVGSCPGLLFGGCHGNDEQA